MATDEFFVSFGWGPRQESLDTIADRLKKFLKDLAVTDRLFATIEKAGGKDHGKRVTGKVQLRRWLSERVNLADDGSGPIDDLGFSTGFLARDADSFAAINICAGVYTPCVQNSCGIRLPSNGPVVDRILQVPLLTAIISTIVESWEPDQGVVASHEFCDRVYGSKRPEFGWLTYIGKGMGDVPPVAPPSRIETMGDGHLIVATDERFSSVNPAHIEIVRGLLSARAARPNNNTGRQVVRPAKNRRKLRE